VLVTLHSTSTVDAAANGKSGASAGGNGSNLNGGAIAGIVIGIISALGTIAGVYFAWLLAKKGNGDEDTRRNVGGNGSWIHR